MFNKAAFYIDLYYEIQSNWELIYFFVFNNADAVHPHFSAIHIVKDLLTPPDRLSTNALHNSTRAVQ